MLFSSAQFSRALSTSLGNSSAGDDLPRVALTLLDHVAVVVADGALAEVVEHAVVAGEVDRDGVHQVLPGVGAVGPDPLIVDLRRVAGDADIDVGALVRGLAREFGEHPVVADADRELRAFRAVADRHPVVARRPRFDRHPRLQLAVVQRDLALVVDDDRGVVRRLLGDPRSFPSRRRRPTPCCARRLP